MNVGEFMNLLSSFPPSAEVRIAHHGADGETIHAHLEDDVVRIYDDGDC